MKPYALLLIVLPACSNIVGIDHDYTAKQTPAPKPSPTVECPASNPCIQHCDSGLDFACLQVFFECETVYYACTKQTMLACRTQCDMLVNGCCLSGNEANDENHTGSLSCPTDCVEFGSNCQTKCDKESQ
jgi:hypothetical protein